MTIGLIFIYVAAFAALLAGARSSVPLSVPLYRLPPLPPSPLSAGRIALSAAWGKGTGQGLALARAVIVEKHRGTLTDVTEMGKGTTFFVRLPLQGAAVREEARLQ